ncbi:MAG: exodeoxyribonuclease VII large subunit [Acidimicrobiales bacterium]
MAATRAKRGQEAKRPGVEELRFDFDEGADGTPAPGLGEPFLSPSVASPRREANELPASLARSVPAESSSAFPGSASDAALSISDFYNLVRGALKRTFPSEVWVTGEIRKVTTSRGHRFLELADLLDPSEGLVAGAAARGGASSRAGNASLEVACWARDWPPIGHELDAVGVELVPGLVVRVRGSVSVWEGASKLRFSMTALDVEALVGGIAAARRRLLALLSAEGLLEANRRLALPLVPLRIGLVTSPGSEAYRDFTGELERSGYRFDIRFEPSMVQGTEAPGQIAAALTRLGVFEPELAVIVRGGGAKGDLQAFDSEQVARAIAEAPFPVWTGIGHTGDRSVADEVAQRALITPTQCGEAVVGVVSAYLEGVERASRRLAQRVEARLNQASRELITSCASARRAAHQSVERSSSTLRGAEARISRAALVTIERNTSRLVSRAQRLAGPPAQLIAVQAQRVSHQRELLQLLNPRHQLERGWSLTRDETGKLVRSVTSLRPGMRLVTTFAEGSAGSVVDQIEKPLGTGTEVNETANDGGTS